MATSYGRSARGIGQWVRRVQVVLSAFPCSGVDRGVAVPGLGGPPLHTTRPATDAPTRHQPVAASCLRATSLFTSHGPAPTVCVPYDINPLLFPSLPTSSLSILNLSNQLTHLDYTPTSIPSILLQYPSLPHKHSSHLQSR